MHRKCQAVRLGRGLCIGITRKWSLARPKGHLGSLGASQNWCEDQVIFEWFLTLYPANCILLECWQMKYPQRIYYFLCQYTYAS